MNQSRADQIEKRFVAFHRENPRVWELFQRFTQELIGAGFTHYSVDAVFQRIRWHVTIETRSPDGLKLNDHYRAYYSRLYHVAHPEHQGFFRERKRTSAERPASKQDVSVFNSGSPTGELDLTDRLAILLSNG